MLVLRAGAQLRLEYDVANREGAVALLQEGSQRRVTSSRRASELHSLGLAALGYLNHLNAPAPAPEPEPLRATTARCECCECCECDGTGRLLRWAPRRSRAMPSQGEGGSGGSGPLFQCNSSHALRSSARHPECAAPDAQARCRRAFAQNLSVRLSQGERLHIPKAKKHAKCSFFLCCTQSLGRTGRTARDASRPRSAEDFHRGRCASQRRLCTEVDGVAGTAAKSPDMAMQIKGHVPSRLRAGRHCFQPSAAKYHSAELSSTLAGHPFRGCGLLKDLKNPCMACSCAEMLCLLSGLL